VQGDEQRLRWALGHLLQNAVRYTESGGHIILTACLSDTHHPDGLPERCGTRHHSGD